MRLRKPRQAVRIVREEVEDHPLVTVSVVASVIALAAAAMYYSRKFE